jgi:hypothetical protein
MPASGLPRSPDINPNPSIPWKDSEQGRAWKQRHGCDIRPKGETVTLDTYVAPDSLPAKRSRRSKSRDPPKSKCDSPACMCTECSRMSERIDTCGAQHMTRTLTLAHAPSIVQLELIHSSNPLTVSCLLDSGSLQNNYVSERVATWCRDQFPRKVRQAKGGSVCSALEAARAMIDTIGTKDHTQRSTCQLY